MSDGARVEPTKFQIKETETLEKFEMEEGGRRLIETIKIVDGVIVSREQPSPQQ